MDVKGGLTLAVQRHVDDFNVAVGREDLGDVSFGDIFGEFFNHNLAQPQHQQSASSSSSSSSPKQINSNPIPRNTHLRALKPRAWTLRVAAAPSRAPRPAPSRTPAARRAPCA